MPSPIRKSNEVWLLVSRRGERESNLLVTAQFKHAYELAIFEHRIGEPSLGERAARELWKKGGPVWLWDRSRFESLEEALWSPVGDAVRLEKIPVKRA